jgi:uncharacterized protein YxjI
MVEVKIQCVCGAKYKFDVEPVNGRMPAPIKCPVCGADGTAAANEGISQSMGVMPAGVAAPAPAGLRIAGGQTHSPPAPSVSAGPPPPPPPGRPALRVAGATAPAPTESGAAPSTHYGSAGPRPLIERTAFFVKERVAMLKLTDTYDILDPATGQQIGIAKEEPHPLAKWLRLVIKKHMMPTRLNIYEHEGHAPVLSIHRGVAFFRTKVRVVAGDGQPIGYFKSKLFSLGGGFHVYDNADRQVADVKGDWKGWNFKFLSNTGREIGTVTKKWAGLGRELFTSADNYIISLSDLSGTSPAASALLLAAGLAIDVVFKEAE